MRLPILLLCAVLLVPAAACRQDTPPPEEEGGVTVVEIARQAPRHARVLLENDYVLAAEFTVPPGEGIPSHYGRNRAVYALGDYRLEFHREDGRIVTESRAGDIDWHAAGLHSVRNVGGSEARFLVVFRKLSRLFEYSFTDEAEDFTCLAGNRSEVLLENEFMRVARFTLAPGDELPAHRGLNRVMYPLAGFDLRYAANGTAETRSYGAGSACYFVAETHAVANVGATEARYLMFELRQ